MLLASSGNDKPMLKTQKESKQGFVEPCKWNSERETTKQFELAWVRVIRVDSVFNLPW